MRTKLCTLVIAATTIIGSAGPALADKEKGGSAEIGGTYDVKYDEVSNNCTNVGQSFTRGTVKIDLKKGLVVNIDLVPIMQGSEPKAGKLKATSKLGPSVIQGLDGKYSVAGRVDDGVLQLVFVAEYYVKGKPLCTQSWNVSGLRQSGATTKSATLENDVLTALMR
jgi:hypothetical protein